MSVQCTTWAKHTNNLTEPLVYRMLFLREFAAAEMGDSEANESGIASDKAIPASARPEKVSSVGIAKSGEAFVPTYVYEAMRENKRFDTMRVSKVGLLDCVAVTNLTTPSAWTSRRRRGIHGFLFGDITRGAVVSRLTT